MTGSDWPEPPPLSGAWMSKADESGKPLHGAAHFVLPSGPYCAGLVLADGEPRMAPFKCARWVPRRASDPLCVACWKYSPAECTCGRPDCVSRSANRHPPRVLKRDLM